MFLDGSDVGLDQNGYQDIDGFELLADNSVLFSMAGDTSIRGIGKIDDSDIIKFTANSLGENTAGTFSLYLDGSDVELTAAGEDIDALALLAYGDLMLSTSGTANVNGLRERRRSDAVQPKQPGREHSRRLVALFRRF